MPDGRRRLRVPAPHSIRQRLLLIVIGAVVLTSALVTLVSVQMLSAFLSNRVETRLHTIAEQIDAAARRAPNSVADASTLRNFTPVGAVVLLEPKAGGAPVAFGATSLGVPQIARAAAQTPAGRPHRITVSTRVGDTTNTRNVALVRVDTHGWRIRLEGVPKPVSAGSIVFATDITADTQSLTQLIWVEVCVGLAAAGAVAGASALVIRTGLRSLTRMAETADAISSGDRSRRLLGDGAGTETDHLAASMNQALDAQRWAEDRLRTFLADVSHELRTPLTTINGWIDLYLQGGLGDRAARDHAMERLEREVSRMRVLVDELTLLARLDANRPIDAVPVDLGRLATEVADDARVITCRAAPVSVDGDEVRLAQVIRNLVGNASQHTPPGTPILIDVDSDRGEAIVRVTDEGPGIDEDDLPHLFDRFWRAEPSRSRATGGSGLGLAITSAIVQAHGGAIRVVSGTGRGSTFTVSLPLSASATRSLDDRQLETPQKGVPLST